MTEQGDVVHLRLVMARRDFEQSKRCGDELERMGFKVVHSSERGVDFEGQVGLAAAVFNLTITRQGDAVRVEGKPELPLELREVASGVYIPTRPTFLP